ncbi:MAG: Fic family protein [Lachnospiraceae bacterium]|nr:Fic family protein [Lachnospiraceae bacterium]
MRDPYLYENSEVLRNKLGLKTQKELDDAEADYVVCKLRQLVTDPIPGDYYHTHLLAMHRFLFEDLFDWAGEFRRINIFKSERVLAGLSIDYSDAFDVARDTENCLVDMQKKQWVKMSCQEAAEEMSESLARLWKIHPFREGNTRTVITFCCQYSDKVGLNLDRMLFEKNSKYVRDALVAYNAVFHDAGDLSQKEHLIRIVKDGIRGKEQK